MDHYEQFQYQLRMRYTQTPLKRQRKQWGASDSNPTINRQKQERTKISATQKSNQKATLIKQLGIPSPKADKFDILKQQPQIIRTKSSNMLKHLDDRDLNFTHKYKQFKSHSKCSDFEQVKSIIEQLLDKHAVKRSLTLSEQYILTGYMGKFIELIKPMKSSVYNSFAIARRLQSKNTLQSAQVLEVSSSPQKRSPSKSKNGNKSGSAAQEKRLVLNKELARLKFLWQLYRLKCLVCPDLNRICEFSQNDAHHQMMDLISRLKTIERSRDKVGEEKSLIQVQKVMKMFEQTMKKSLC